MVNSTDPTNFATGVAINKNITVQFSEAIDASTLSTATFIVKQGTTTVPGVVLASRTTAIFIPSDNLSPNTTFTATITTGIKDLAHNAMAANYVWSFTSGTTADITSPLVNFTDPLNAATNVIMNKIITVTFSKAMDASIMATAFTLMQGTTSIPGAVTYSGTTASFNPSNNLSPNTTYTGTVSTAAKDIAGNALSSNYVWNFTTGTTQDITAPTVILTDPLNLATDVVLTKKVSATFSEAIDASTLSTATFILKQGSTTVSGVVLASGMTAVFIPAYDLTPNTTYTATITTGIKDLANNALASNYVWSFTTGARADVTPPIVNFTDPLNAATNVVMNKIITVTFSEAMNASSMSTAFTLMQGNTSISGTVTYSGTTASFSPTNNLNPNTTYIGTVSTAAKDIAGNALASNYVWNFTTGTTQDFTAPIVSSTDPVNLAIGVALTKKISATFSEAIDASTLSTATFVLKQGSITVPGVVLASGMTAVFIPSDNLSPNTKFTATITTGIKDLAHNAMAANYVWSFTTEATADITPPLINFTDPVNAATNVAVNKKITVTFSEPMNVSTMATAFTLMKGTTSIPGTVTYFGTTASFDPSNNLAPNTTYTGTVSTAAKDIAGNTLVSDYVWNFTTGETQDITAPKVNLTDPLNLATDVAITKKVSATFSEAIDASTITTATFTLMLSQTVVSGTVSYSGLTAVFTPLSNLLPNTLYTATITKSIKDLAGNAMASNYVWTFTTSATSYTVTLLSSPASGGTTSGGGSFDSGSPVTVTATPKTGYTFSNWTESGIIVSTNTSYPFTITGNRTLIANFIAIPAQYTIVLSSNPLVGGTTSGGGKFNSGSSVTVTATPKTGYTFSNWTENGIIVSTNTNYQFTIAQDRTLVANFTAATAQYSIALSSNPLVGGTTSGGGSFNSGTLVTVTATPNAGYTFTSWTEGITIVSSSANYTFTITGNKILVANFTAIGPSGPAGVNLGSAGNFAVIAGSSVSNTGVTTKIYGDVGSFPTATINGLLAGNVIGILYTTADPLVGAAKNDLTAAYNDAQGRSLNAISLPGQLGGLTLAPGLYVNSTSSGISGTGANGILTLDAGGNPNAVWIFKMGSTLITSTGTSIVLAGGAKWSNIYWSVGTSATLGTNSIFYGNILADQSITLTTGATLRGRALTRIGSVTLDTNIVDKR